MHIDCKNAAEMRIAGPILESKDMCAIFPKKGEKKEQNLSKNVQNVKVYVRLHAIIACIKLLEKVLNC